MSVFCAEIEETLSNNYLNWLQGLDIFLAESLLEKKIGKSQNVTYRLTQAKWRLWKQCPC